MSDATSGRMIADDGSVVNVADTIGGVKIGGTKNIKSYVPKSGRMLDEDGNVVNFADLIGGTSVGKVSNINSYAPSSGCLVKEDGTIVNITKNLKSLLSGGGGGSSTNGLQWKIDNMNSLYQEFVECQLENVDGALVGLDTTNLKSTESMFVNCDNLTSVPMFDMSHVENTTTMFSGCPKLVSVPEYDLSSCTKAQSMFSGCSSLTSAPLKNTGNIANMYGMFTQCKQMTSAPEFDTSGATDMHEMFYSCVRLVDVPEYDMSSCTNVSQMFYGCTGLTDTKLNLPKVANATYMFYGCSNLKNVDLSLPTDLDVSYTADYMFRNCSGLTNINLNFSRVSSLDYCFQYCSQLEEAHLTSTSNATNVSSMFQECTKLTTVTGLDFINVTASSVAPFGKCTNLTNLTIKNIKKPMFIGSGTTYGHLLTVDSLVNTIKELWDYSSGTSTYKLTMGTANTAKLADVYVKLITPTEEQIANDPYIESKMPCEVCESTDEGAMLILDYLALKKWTYA